VDVPVLPEFKWTSAGGATSYQVQVAGSALFFPTVMDVTGIVDTTYTDGTPLAYSTSYFWRVRGVNGEGDGGWSSALQFTTGPEPPPTPTLLDPPDGAIDVQTKPTLTWNSADRADSYALTIATDIGFTSVVAVDSGLVGTSYMPDPALTVNTTYYWRVNATNAGGTSSWSSTWSFTTYPTEPPAPALVSPPDGGTGVATRPDLSWNSSPGADTYGLQVATTVGFDSVIVDESGVATTSYAVQVTLDSAAMYYWRVNASNSGGASAWSTIWSFTVTGDPPDVPVLADPVDGEVDIPLSPTMAWNTAGGTDTYRLQVSSDSTFSSTHFDTAGVRGTAVGISGLARNTTYYWRVNGTNALGTSGWSEVWSFLTIPEIPTIPTLVSPPDGATDYTDMPTFIWNRAERAASYDFQLSYFDGNWDDSLLAIDQEGLADTVLPSPFELYGGSPYFWRVRAVNPGGTSEWSAASSFTTLLEAPIAPLLYSPVNGTTDMSAIVVLAWWRTTNNPADYFRLQVATDSMFRKIYLDQDLITDDFVPNVFTAGLKYYWRVLGTNVVGTGPWSEAWWFTRSGTPPTPDIPVAEEPTSITDTSFTAVWTASLTASDYRLDVATDSLFGSLVPGYADKTVVDTSDVVVGLSGGTTYYVRVRASNSGGVSGNSNVVQAMTSDVVVDITICLAGPFAGDSMSTALNSAGIIPSTQPYNVPPWDYAGTESVASTPSDVVDWVLVELRIDSATIGGRRACFLKSDGSVVDTSGTGPVRFPGVTNGTYYVVVHHRNHLPVMSSVMMPIGAGSSLYDFTTSASQAYGTGALVDLGSGSGPFGMFAGDSDINGGVGASDLVSVRQKIGSALYEIDDVDMNGGVGASDLVAIRPNIGQVSQVPEEQASPQSKTVKNKRRSPK
jgi:hypothetical protein